MTALPRSLSPKKDAKTELESVPVDVTAPLFQDGRKQHDPAEDRVPQ